MRTRRLVACFLLAAGSLIAAQTPTRKPTTAVNAPQRDTSYIDANGTAHVTRVVPLPRNISPQARAMLGRPMTDAFPPQSLAARRADLNRFEKQAQTSWGKLCPFTSVNTTIAGVPVHIITPKDLSPDNNDKILINLHGGGFDADSGSYSETIPIASYTQTRVVAVLYRLAPEHPFPAGLDDAIAVYRAMLKTHDPDHIVIYGTSAGAILTGEVAVKIKQLGLPMPAALGIFSGTGDFTHWGDSQALFGLNGLSGHLRIPGRGHQLSDYVGKTNQKNPVLSPIYANLSGMPPTLFFSGTRDMLLSGTADLDRAFLEAGDDANLVVFDAMPHAFWIFSQLPEAIEANHIMADFFTKQLNR